MKRGAFRMQPMNYLVGGIVPRKLLKRIMPILPSSSDFYFQDSTHGMSTFLYASGNHIIFKGTPEHALVVAGHVCHSKKESVASEALDEIEKYYLAEGRLPFEHLEGSFAVILLDKKKSTVTVYKNIFGLPHEASSGSVKFDSEALVDHLTFNRVSGRSTLFEDVFRVLPGEQVVLGNDSLTCLQLQTFDSLTGPKIKGCVEQLEAVMQGIISEYAKMYSPLGSLFSGGVDSSYVQAHLIRFLGSDVPTYSVDLLHPSWKAEREYAESGSEFFKSRHTFVEIDPLSFPGSLREATALLGQPVCHAQLGFIPELSKAAAKTTSVCLCGMAADVLFGEEVDRRIDISAQIQRILPWKFMRQAMIEGIQILGELHVSSDRLQTLRQCLELELVDESSPTHPFNAGQHEVLQQACHVFGKAAVEKAMLRRRSPLEPYQIAGSLKERLSSLLLLTTQQVCERMYQIASFSGLRLLFPYMDSRMVKAALSMKADCRFSSEQTKKLLKDALEGYLPRELIYRKKSAWGVPMTEWLEDGGILSEFVENINEYPFLRGKIETLKRKPDWFLWNLVTFDLWYKAFMYEG
jgi:asparagine synthetase B (glutamine-hydrolysing)